ncbi:MAG: sensor histidine kinase [Hyphomonadaceae bacterium]|nr:sensor histidine kinase [Clostridia bacterium]
MRELSLHILDIIQNAITAQAKLITLDIIEDRQNNWLTVTIKDNGKGMDEAFVKTVLDPFCTSRKTRKVGLGLSLFRTAAQYCEGDLTIASEVGVGTTVTVTFRLGHIDRAPMGDMGGTVVGLIIMNPTLDFCYGHQCNAQTFTLDTREIRAQLGDVPLNYPDVVEWLKAYTAEGLENIVGGVNTK